jgi:hypothetical protein
MKRRSGRLRFVRQLCESVDQLAQSADGRHARVPLRQLVHAFLDQCEDAQPECEHCPVRELLKRRDDDRPRDLQISWIEPYGWTMIWRQTSGTLWTISAHLTKL